MSAIFGRYYFDEKPVSQSTLLTMQQAMANWGPDGNGTWCAGQVGMGHLRRDNTPESQWDFLPWVCPSSGDVITASARLDNRDELLRALSIPRPDWANLPDSHIILNAYQKWGEACVDRLLGDWAFAIWNVSKRRLFIGRDHHGNSGLYYYNDSRCLSFASSLKGLLVLPEVPQRPNPLTIAQLLVSWPGQGETTCYEGILRLPPAHIMTITPQGIEVKRYWYLEHTPELHLSTDDDYVEAFLEIYTEAVRCRLRCSSPVGATLSGGLDSGSVAALAARDLAKRSQRLTTFSSVPTADTEGLVGSRMGDEAPLIKATAEFAGNIDLNYVYARDISPLAGIEKALSIHDQPMGAAGNMYWLTALMAEAQRQGFGAILTGQGGNATISWHGGYETPLLEYLLKAQWGTFRRKLRDWKERTGRSLLGALRSQIYRPIEWHTRQSLRRLKSSKEAWRDYSAINVAFARELDLDHHMERHGHDPMFRPKRDLRQARLAVARPGSHTAGHLWSELGAAYGLEVRDPTFDQRVMSFCLSIPESQYRVDGQNRMLIRRAMAGYLPKKVLWNRNKGIQSADIAQRIVEHRCEIGLALTKLERSELACHYLDLPRMRTIFEAVQHKIDGDSFGQSTLILLRGLMVGQFLLRFE
jgi:asparagine synthase (glutamine-hydrolysing)